MIPYLAIADVVGIAGFAAAFWFAFSYYTKTRFNSPLGILYYTLMTAGLLWSLSLLLSDFYVEFTVLSPWFFAFMLSMLVGVVFTRGT